MASIKQLTFTALVLGIVGQATANTFETDAEAVELAARSEGELYAADSGLMAMKRDELVNSVVDGLVARFAEDDEVVLAARGSKSCSKKLKALKKKYKKAKGLLKKASRGKKGKKSKKAGKKSGKKDKKHKKDKKEKKHKKDKKEKKDKDDE